MTDEFAGRTALVTGGSRGIGRAVCLALARRGARVAVNYRSGREQAERTVAEIRGLGGEGLAVAGDVADRAGVAGMVEEVVRALGPVDYLVNNAGVFDMVTHEQHTPEIWRRTLDVNLTGAYQMIWAVKDAMIARRFGRIVNMSSISGLGARPVSIPYAVSKAGLISLTKCCAAAFAPFNIRVNAVAPGLVESEMLHRSPDEVLDKLIELTPMQRVGTPDEIARTVVFLLSDESSFTTGQTLLACGGRMMLP